MASAKDTLLLGEVHRYVEVFPQPLARHRLVRSMPSEQISQRVVEKVTSRRSPTSDSISRTQSDMETLLSVQRRSATVSSVKQALHGEWDVRVVRDGTGLRRSIEWWLMDPMNERRSSCGPSVKRPTRRTHPFEPTGPTLRRLFRGATVAFGKGRDRWCERCEARWIHKRCLFGGSASLEALAGCFSGKGGEMARDVWYQEP